MSFASKQGRADSPLVVQKDHRLDYRAFINDARALPEGDETWGAMCESLQRQAHGFAAKFGSALAHQIATPKSERIDPREAPFSAFIFVDDPSDSNPFGHIVGKWGDAKAIADIPVSTNDVSDNEAVYDYGNVTVVPLGWFPGHWGDAVQFATLWYGDTSIPLKDPKPSAAEDTEAWVRRAIARAQEVVELMRKALQDNDGRQHPKHEAACKREIAHQKRLVAELRRLLP